MSTIDDIRLKVERAEVHIDNFETALNGGHGSIDASQMITLHHEPNWKNVHIKAKFSKPPLQLGIEIGDAVHQLRASLDHVIYALARRTKTLTSC